MCCTLVHKSVPSKKTKNKNWLFTVINNCMLIVFVSTFTSLSFSSQSAVFVLPFLVQCLICGLCHWTTFKVSHDTDSQADD